mgnify:CR=1 FL=1
MSLPVIILLIVLAVLIIGTIVLYFLGKKAEKKQAEQQQQLDAMAQNVTMLIIDKKHMKLKEAVFLPSCWRVHRNICAEPKFRL